MRALVISGGGSKGAFAGGVAQYLLEIEKNKYDIFIGTSTGSLLIPHLALGNIDKSLNTELNNSNAYYMKGAIFHKKLNNKEALFNYKKAIQINSKNTDAMLKCGIVYGKTNDIVNACKYFSMACKNGSDDGCTGYSSFCK